MGKAKINSTKVDELGKVIKAHLPTWKLENPGKLVFDSRFEWGCWMRLKESKIPFTLKPEALILIPKQKQRILCLAENAEKELKANIRDAVCKADKTMYKRLANKRNVKVLKEKNVFPTTWSPDFLVPMKGRHKAIYIESKGFANEAFPIKLKLAQYLFNPNAEFFVVHTLKEMDDLLINIKKELLK